MSHNLYPDRNSDYGGRGADPYQYKGDPYMRNEDPYRRNDPYGQRDDPYRRNDPYSPREDPYAKPHGGKSQDGYIFRKPSDGYHSDSFRSSADMGGYGAMGRPDPAIYEVDHLVTFDVSPKQGVRHHADGLERLKHMEMTSGVWTMRHLLSIDDKEVVITEKATRKELVTFPISRVLDPINITNDDPKEVYNNIVIFIVRGDATKSTSEMHIFQCIGKPGQDLIDDIEAARIGKFPRPAKNKRSSALSEEQYPKRSSALSDEQYPAYRTPINNKPRPTTSAEAAGYENDIETLNHCFDDIEGFIASLQKAANAKKKIDLSRSSGNFDQREMQMLEEQAKPPSTREFIETFQKFKHAFNLLPKLKHLLRDPSSDELIHSLFAPLALVVNASRDPQGQPQLAKSVTSPLLNDETCLLLDSCLRSHEVSLWRSLGEAWTLPAEYWKGPVPPPYTPRWNDSKQGKQTNGMSNGGGGSSYPGGNSMGSNGSSKPLNAQEEFLRTLKARNAKAFKVIQSRVSKNPKELTVTVGEYVEVIDDAKNWWKVTNMNRESGYVPKTILNPA